MEITFAKTGFDLEAYRNLSKGSWRLTVLTRLSKMIALIKKDLQAPTLTWDKRPKIEANKIFNKVNIGFTVWTEDFLYNVICKGVEKGKYVIEPKDPEKTEYLVFDEFRQSKTDPNALTANAERIDGEGNVHAKIVLNWGVRARNWDQVTAENREDEIEEMFEDILVEIFTEALSMRQSL